MNIALLSPSEDFIEETRTRNFLIPTSVSTLHQHFGDIRVSTE